ncbi:MAG: phosphate ABC transporter permease subunit PstC [Bacilli bacterium]
MGHGRKIEGRKMEIKNNIVEKNKFVDKLFQYIFLASALFASLSVLFILGFIFTKAVKPFLPDYEFGQQSIIKFIFGTAYRSDQQIYGIGFIIINTVIISLSALFVCFPISIVTSLFCVKFAPKKLKPLLKSSIELLASIPSVIYGVFGYGVITVFVDNLAKFFGYESIQGLSSLAAIIILALMIFPTMTLISISSIERVSKSMEEASYALGATKVQTNYKVVLRGAKNGIFSGMILGLGRAYGEATAVSMVIGNAMIGPTIMPFMPSRTLTSTILLGLKETSGLDYDIRFSIAFVLLCVIISSNLALNFVKKKVLR